VAFFFEASMILATTEPDTVVWYVDNNGEVGSGILRDGCQQQTELVPVDIGGSCLAKTRSELYLTEAAAVNQAVMLAARRCDYWHAMLAKQQDRKTEISTAAQQKAAKP
jgi:hypothetical protein